MRAVERKRIDAFSSPGEFTRFAEAIDAELTAGSLSEMPPVPQYGVDFIYGGRWFKDTASGRVWRLVAPDCPYKGVWEPIGG